VDMVVAEFPKAQGPRPTLILLVAPYLGMVHSATLNAADRHMPSNRPSGDNHQGSHQSFSAMIVK